MTTANRTRRESWSRRLGGSLAFVSAVMLAGCDLDSLLEVELPGVVAVEDLSDPAFARMLVQSARGDFECAFNHYVWHTAVWTTQFHITGLGRSENIIALRHPSTRDYDQLEGGNTNCRSTDRGPATEGPHVARVQAANAITRIEGFDQKDLQDEKDFLVGESYFYMAYSIQILAEEMCELTFDGGPVETRAQGFKRADDAFAQALSRLAGITSGRNATRAEALRNAALVGRARANLHLGSRAEVVRFASQVPVGFVFNVTRAVGSVQTENLMFNKSNPQSFGSAAAAPWHNLTVQGVPDPRVPLQHIGVGRGADGITDIWIQRKYTSASSPIPLATWREAQLMIAEVELGQTAVSIINKLRDTHKLPHFASTDPAEIRKQVIEERLRELWLQGTIIGDMLRLDLPWNFGQSPKGDAYGEDTCVPFPMREVIGNPNVNG